MRTARKSDASTAKYLAKRNHILGTALELFRSNGYDATSLQQVADESGFLKGSLYYYVRSKEDLLVELVEEVHAAFGRTLEEYRQLEGPVLLRIEALLRNAALDAGRNQKFLTVFYREFTRIDPERREKIVELRDKQEQILRSLIIEGQQLGEIRGDVDPKIATIALESMSNSVYNWYRPDGRMSLERIADELATLAVRSLRAQPDATANDRR